MKIKTLVSKFFASNTYIVSSNNTAIIIDPSVEVKIAKTYLNDVKIKAIFLTHAHADHFIYLQQYIEEYSCPVYCHPKAFDKIEDPDKNLSYLGGRRFSYQLPKSQFIFVDDNGVYEIDDIIVKVIETPGHSDCSVCYLIDEAMFSGDTLFKLSVGRTDLYSSNTHLLIASLSKIYNLDSDYFIYPGHDESTLLSFEKKHNRYFKRVKS